MNFLLEPCGLYLTKSLKEKTIRNMIAFTKDIKVNFKEDFN